MIEWPEACTLARQLQDHVMGKIVQRVCPPTKEHKLCWFAGDPADYGGKLAGRKTCSAEAFGFYVEIGFDQGLKLCLSDGINMRYCLTSDIPKDYQLLIAFTDGTALVFSVGMYGGIFLHDGSWDSPYYQHSRAAVPPVAPDFPKVFYRLLSDSKPSLSLKAFLATEQRFPGIGNGVLQDILLMARLNPKMKLEKLNSSGAEKLQDSIVAVMNDMRRLGGRDTEKDLLGQPGGYKTLLSKNTISGGCPLCKGAIRKEAYLGGSIYYCPSCQPSA
jgi:formamidopyrimidine-DNA glycosylase